ncbi:MAG: hypothetical protein K6T17_08170 [Fimbriimonadales bacterium]|nr:hypothetical protein [Fimbriimonadales bacterium]
MAKMCQITKKKPNNARHIRHLHSGQWKFRAPRKPRRQIPNLQTVTIQTPNGKVRLRVSARAMKSAMLAEVISGLRPIPKEWLKKARYED